MIAVVAVVLLLLALAIGVPIAYSLLLAGVAVLWWTGGSGALVGAAQIVIESVRSFDLSAIPFFIVAAELLIESGATRALVKAAEAWTGHLPGGMSSVAIVATTVFAALSGSSSATAAAISPVLIPEMEERGYDHMHTLGLFGVAGGLGILIPPSIPLIVYGTVAQVSVTKLFIAAIVPGLLLAFGLWATAVWLMRERRPMKRYSMKERVDLLRKASWILLLPVFIAVGMYSGIFTPTEAAGISAVYAVVYAVLVDGRLRNLRLFAVLGRAAAQSAMILMIIGGASVFRYVLTLQGIPQDVTGFVLHHSLTPFTFLLFVNFLLLLLGMFLDLTSITLLTVPLLIPVMVQMNIDPIQFGIIMATNMELALITPPVGMNLFVLSAMTDNPITTVLRATIPYTAVMVVTVALVTYVPALTHLL